MVVVVDFLVGILLMQQAIIALSTIQKLTPHIPTYGQYAVVIEWPLDRNDIDLYTQDPQGNICYFANVEVDQMHLEHDDLGTDNSGYKALGYNYERTILRGYSQGEYTVNAHFYMQRSPGAVTVTVQLWSLRGPSSNPDRIVYQDKVTLAKQGDQQTAFRFTLDGNGNVTGENHLQKDLVGLVTAGGANG